MPPRGCIVRVRLQDPDYNVFGYLHRARDWVFLDPNAPVEARWVSWRHTTDVERDELRKKS